ncbi:sialidase family protein [Scopulibacillus darangshiensis]|uniref:sialidase family protein n=1 Tax=Scopulibacillus darangshiensis TaxID=442528 RepID=UPI001043EBD6|nr:sialidase family protein [Scopulibacillus darangshiensis]
METRGVAKRRDSRSGKARLIFSNPASTSGRQNGTIRISENGGKTWNRSSVVTPGDYAYSSLTVLPNGKIGLLYENNKGSIMFTTISRSSLK